MKRLYMYACAAVALLLSGCIDSVGLQREYVASRDGCREMAEMKMGLYVQPGGFPVSEKEKNAMLLSLFSECMRGENWAVAKPKEPPKEEPPKQVAGVVPPVGNTLPISTAASVRPPGTLTTAPVTNVPAGTAYMLVPVVPTQQPVAPAATAPAPSQYNPNPYAPPAQPVVVPVVPVQPQQSQSKTVLRNKGVGVGVGPTYSLEKMISKE
jgi:hypothetical protein